VLAEEASPLRDIDVAALESRLATARANLAAAENDEDRARHTREITIVETMIVVAR
jgi:F0F1-type ATP synthase epsilon subunit